MKNKQKKTLFLLFILVVISVVIFFLKEYYPSFIKSYCDKKSANIAEGEATKKGYKPSSDTYFVIYTLTNENENNKCLYKFGLIENKNNGWNFDWLPNSKE